MTLNAFLLGAIATLCFVIVLIFVRFWKRTGDRFFLLFGTSFFVEGVGRVALALLPLTSEYEPVIFTGRLVAFLIIIYAIVDKNLINRRSGSDGRETADIDRHIDL